MYVAVHGGAGSPPDEPVDRQRALAAAVARAARAEAPLSAVCAAVRPLERDPAFNAGVGGAVQSDGVVRTEASLMADDETAGASRSDDPDPETPDPDLAAVAQTAGEAAARIESADGDNEVYRAWREMTEALDVDRPASATPAEFATAAVAAGVAEEPVAELTEVFEQVRYGGADPTDERERRAAAALRQIEATHGVNG